MKTSANLSDKSDYRIEALLGFLEDARQHPGTKRVQLYRAMQTMIQQGLWNPGDRLPTDVEFARLLPVSTATAQGALKMLADQGVLERKKRNGTFVASERNLERNIVFFRFTDNVTPGVAATDVLRATVEEVSEIGPWSSFLGTRPNYIRVTRLINVASKFKILSQFYFSDPRLRILLDLPPDWLKDITVRPLLQLRFGLPFTELEWKVSFTHFDPEVAQDLSVASGTQGQRFDVEVRTIDRAPLSVHRIWVPPNDLSLMIGPL